MAGERETLKEAESGNLGLDVYLENSEKERSRENIRKTAGLAAAASAAFIPFGLGSAKIVVLGRENFFTCVFRLFNIIRQVFGGVF